MNCWKRDHEIDTISLREREVIWLGRSVVLIDELLHHLLR